MERNSEVKRSNEEEKLDLLHVFKVIWNKKLIYIATGSIAVVLGVIVAFSIPPKYTSQVILAPELESAGANLSQNISNIASLAGINLSAGKSGSVDAFYPEIYPQVVSSSPFLKDVLKTRVTAKDSSFRNITAYRYLQRYQKKNWWLKIIALFQKKKNNSNAIRENADDINIFSPTKTQDVIIQELNNSISCSVDTKTSIITIQVTTQDPLVSATLANSVQQNIQDYITNYRTKKARNDLAYAEKLVKDAFAKYKQSQQKYAAYADANEDIILQSFASKRDEMENNMQLRYNIYNSLIQQVQLARAKVQERTPAFAQIQPASVSLKKSSPKRMTIVICFIFISFVLTSVYALIKDA